MIPKIEATRLKRIFGLAMPIVAGMLSQNLLNLVDTAMVGRLVKYPFFQTVKRPPQF